MLILAYVLLVACLADLPQHKGLCRSHRTGRGGPLGTQTSSELQAACVLPGLYRRPPSEACLTRHQPQGKGASPDGTSKFRILGDLVLPDRQTSVPIFPMVLDSLRCARGRRASAAGKKPQSQQSPTVLLTVGQLSTKAPPSFWYASRFGTPSLWLLGLVCSWYRKLGLVSELGRGLGIPSSFGLPKPWDPLV